MKKEEIEKMLGYVSELGAFLTRLKHVESETESDVISEAVEKYLDGFNIEKRRCALSEDLQFNKKTQNSKVFSEKEMKEMPYLKDLKYRITKNGIHQFRYRRHGYNESFNSKSFVIAKKKAYDFIRKLNKELKKDVFIKVKERSLDFVAQAWFENKKNHIDPSTYKSYLNVYKNHIQPAYGNYDIKNILPMHLQSYFDELHVNAGRTCETVKIILNCVFKYAIANRFTTFNPIDGVIVEKHYRTPGKALSDIEIAELKKIAENLTNGYGIASLIILYTGIRGAELSSLKFDWENGTFSVNNAKLKKSQKICPEKLTRTVPIFPALYKLKERIENEKWNIKRNTLSNDWRRYYSFCSVKDLRHTFSTRARESGIENELVNIWMGHVPGTNLTANTYTHLSLDYQKSQAKKMKPY